MFVIIPISYTLIYYPSSAIHNIRNHDDTINIGKLIEEEINKDQKNEIIKETGMVFSKKNNYIYK